MGDKFIDSLCRYRIALIPQYEGGWQADMYGEHEYVIHAATGYTPQEAVEKVIALKRASE